MLVSPGARKWFQNRLRRRLRPHVPRYIAVTFHSTKFHRGKQVNVLVTAERILKTCVGFSLLQKYYSF